MAAKHLSDAEAALDKDEEAEALAQGKKALELFRAAGDESSAADALRVIIGAYIAQDEAKEADALAEKELEGFRQSSDQRGEAMMLLSLAEIGADSKRTKAERWATKASKLFHSVDDKKMEAAALNFLAGMAHKEKEADEAFRTASEALALAQEAEDKKGEALAYHGIGLSCALNKAYGEALDYAEKALAIYQELKLPKMESKELCAIAECFLAQDKPAAAVSRAFDALAAKAGNDQVRLVVEALVQARRAKEAVKVAQDGVDQAKSAKRQRGQAVALQVLSKAQLADGSPDAAVKSAEEALEVFRSLADQKQEWNLLNTISVLHVARKRPEQAKKALDDAIVIAEDLDLKAEQAQTMTAIAQLQVDMKQYDKALTSAMDAAKIYQDEGDRRGEASAWAMASAAYSMNGAPAKALAAASTAYELFFVAGDLKQESNMLYIMAELKMAEQNYDSALKDLTKAAAAMKETGDPKKQAEGVRRLAVMYLAFGRLQEAAGMIMEARQISAAAADEEGEAAAQILMVQVYVQAYESENPSGDAYLTSSSLASMVDVTKEAVSLAAKTSDASLQATAQLWRGHALMWSTRPPSEDAMKAATQAESLFKKAQDKQGEVGALVLQAYLHLGNSRMQQAKTTAGQALSIAQSENDVQGQNNVSEAMDFFDRLEQQAAVSASRQGAVAGGGRPGRPGAPIAEMAVSEAKKGGGAGLDEGVVRNKLMEMVRNVMAADEDPALEEPLMDAGMDSLSATDFTTQIAREFRLSITPSLVFDYPNLREITQHLVEESQS